VKAGAWAGLALVGMAAYVATHPTALAQAQGQLAKRRPQVAGPAVGAACPAAGPVTSGWGPRWGAFHDGVDIGAPLGSPIRAVAAGTVVKSVTADPGGYGQYINIEHADGSTTQYGHMRVRLVHTGDRVRAGQVIARVGAEGSATGPHLHLRVYPPGRSPPQRGTNPTPWLKAHGVRLPCRG
jgi:murein DD-endopeptidase MepM/ murein hydrolase activator NlpD